VIKHSSLAVILPVLFSLLLTASACSEASPAFGKYFRGRTLDLNVVALERLPELRYATIDANQAKHHYRIVPSSEDLELVLLRIKVENHTATSAIVDIDGQAAELRDFFRGSYRPIDVNQRVEEVSAPENPGAERSMVFLWNQTLEDGTSKAFELKKDFGLDGWMVFEAPRGNKFSELRWRAGDSLTINF
jgi:hypothetical protein